MGHFNNLQLAVLAFAMLFGGSFYCYVAWRILTSTQRGKRWHAERQRRSWEKRVNRSVERGYITQEIADTLREIYYATAPSHHAA